VLDSAARVLNIGITLKKRTIFAPIVIVAALAVNIGLNFLLIPKYGSLGATISTLISYAVFCALRFWASNLFFKVHYEWGRVFTMGAIGALIVVVFYVIDYLRGDLSVYSYDDPARRRIIYLSASLKVLLALSFPLMLFALRFYDERERRRLAEIWQKFSGGLRDKPKSKIGKDEVMVKADESFDAGD
jgi:O-antigen/teichoic acid export membrane protein